MINLMSLFPLDFSLLGIGILFLSVHLLVTIIRGLSKYRRKEKYHPDRYGTRSVSQVSRVGRNLHICLFSFKTLYTAGYITAAIFFIILIQE